ncbi:hypothetical protein M408DRAFT_328773 [Serendipita vermifera MAFF 305830]|uniref:Ubiquitin-conjugating enzyme E2 H n=1 Tax=Serendipita vermifera MAFF 305830 TaxID=933852 RepID=A0A0C2XKG0_SERVB|nr:hypothetical protein M408DRAFT_328773 [Serendipita vermifera MAFF 305830]
MTSNFEVELVNDSVREFHVTFHGPADTLYSGGVWKIHVELPEQYPYKSPSIGFLNKILHPNIDETSGSVCLDVINQTWSPMYDMINIFEVFLPQLLAYPNVSDPLNAEAAHLMQGEPALYEAKVKEYVKRFASREATGGSQEKENQAAEEEEEEEDHVMSDVSLSDDEDAAGDIDL